jgi:tight adherence protein B
MNIPLLPASILFVLCISALAVFYFAARNKRIELDRRFSLARESGTESADEDPALPSRSRAFDKLGAQIQSFFTFGAGYTWGMHASPASLLAAALASAGAAWLLAWRGLSPPAPLIAALSAAAALFGPRLLLHRQQERANRHFTNLFPDAVDMVARILRGGMPITYAIQIAGKEAPPPVDKVFAMVSDQLRIGIPVAEALDLASKRVALPDFRFFALAAIMQYSTGGNLIATLEDLSQIMRKRQSMRAKAKALSAEIRFSAYVLGALPILVIAALLVIEPDYLEPLFADRRGHMILAMAGTGLALSFLLMRQMIKSVSRE